MKAIPILLFVISSFAYSENKTNSIFKNNELEILIDNSSELWFVGDSTLHSFIVHASSFTAKSEISLARPKVQNRHNKCADLFVGNAIHNFVFSVPVSGLKADSDSLNDNMYEALKMKKCPRIEFSLLSYKASSLEDASHPLLINAAGRLSIACVSKRINLELKCDTNEDVVRISGNKELKMTDFNIDPPTILFNAIKTDDTIKVYFELNLKMIPTHTSKGIK